MIVSDAFTSDAPHQFLMALNNHSGFIPRFVEQERVPYTAPPPAGFKPIKGFSLRPKNKALDLEVRAAYVARLQELADAWIGTGKTDGVEEPLKRTLRWEAFKDPVKRTFTWELRRTLIEWAARNQPDFSFTYSGEREVLMPACKMDFHEPMDAALNDAVRFFGRFLDSPYRFRLFKCQRCSAYYFTERKPRGPIRFGTYCLEHRHAATANRSNARKRAPEYLQKLQFAAEAWGQAPDALKVVQYVNTALRRKNLLHRYAPIKRNWVTHHRAEIEAEAERRAHAKG